VSIVGGSGYDSRRSRIVLEVPPIPSTTPDLEEIAAAKQAVRERVWSLLERRRAARFPGARGRIPNFAGAGAAADRLGDHPAWRDARVLKANPDAPQLPVRARALAEGKRVYMAVPRLRERRPFVLLDPARLQVPPRSAASIRGMGAGRPVSVRQVRLLDLVVCGSVAVNHEGARIGKGGGYSDLELALLTEAGRVGDDTIVVTTVHPLQVLNEDLPETAHDFRVDLIVTPEEWIRPKRSARRRPPGILWDHLTPEILSAVPSLRALSRE
jgi:5-formyltetrahydrofolate cyclo-ligase